MTPQILSARTARAAPTATSCTRRADDSGVLVPPAYISADMPLGLLKRKPSPQCAWLLPQLSAIPSTASLTHSARVPTVWDWSR